VIAKCGMMILMLSLKDGRTEGEGRARAGPERHEASRCRGWEFCRCRELRPGKRRKSREERGKSEERARRGEERRESHHPPTGTRRRQTDRHAYSRSSRSVWCGPCRQETYNRRLGAGTCLRSSSIESGDKIIWRGARFLLLLDSERPTDRQTDRPTDRQTDRHRQTWTTDTWGAGRRSSRCLLKKASFCLVPSRPHSFILHSSLHLFSSHPVSSSFSSPHLSLFPSLTFVYHFLTSSLPHYIHLMSEKVALIGSGNW